MAPFPNGPSNPHIKKSHGGDTNLMKFYATTNATTYGAHHDNFVPRTTRHTGTGYLANFRPQIQYTSRLDKVDNPPIGKLIMGNYKTVMKRDFNPYGAPNGKERFPTNAVSRSTGFVNEKALTVPNFKTVRKTCIDGRIVATAPADIAPKHRPLLHKIKNKDPIESQNAGHGPLSKETEYGVRYTGRPADIVNLSVSSVGPKEKTGFTQNHKTIEPVQAKPDSSHMNDKPGWMTHRPTGHSMSSTFFRPLEYLHGAEPLPKVANPSSRSTGFTLGANPNPAYVNRIMSDAYDKVGQMGDLRAGNTKRSDPAEFLNCIHPNNYSSVSQGTYLGQPTDPSAADRLGRTAAGHMEPTGHVSNSDSYVQQPEDMSRFITNYNTKFYNVTAQGRDREGHLSWGLHKVPMDGYTKSTKMHDFGPKLNTCGEIRGMDPYQARSLKARDAFADDHLYDSKLHGAFGRQMTVI